MACRGCAWSDRNRDVPSDSPECLDCRRNPRAIRFLPDRYLPLKLAFKVLKSRGVSEWE